MSAAPFDPAGYVVNHIVLVYGVEKIGKTTCLATLPGRVWIADVDLALENLLQTWKERGRSWEDLQVHRIETFSQVAQRIYQLPTGFDCYVIDSFTKIGLRAIHEVSRKEIEEDGVRRMNKDRIARVVDNLVDCYEMFESQIRRFNQAGQRAWGIVVAHERLKEEPTPGGKQRGGGDPVLKIEPDIYGRVVPSHIGRSVDFVFRLERAKTVVAGEIVHQRVFRSEDPAGNVLCGGRVSGLNATEPADFAALFEKIEAIRAKRFPQQQELK